MDFWVKIRFTTGKSININYMILLYVQKGRNVKPFSMTVVHVRGTCALHITLEPNNNLLRSALE